MTAKDVFKIQNVNSLEKFVLLYLFHKGCAREHKKIKIEDVMESCSLSRSSVGRAFKGLEDNHIIDVFYQRGKNQAKHIKITLGKEEAC